MLHRAQLYKELKDDLHELCGSQFAIYDIGMHMYAKDYKGVTPEYAIVVSVLFEDRHNSNANKTFSRIQNTRTASLPAPHRPVPFFTIQLPLQSISLLKTILDHI